MTDPTHTQVQAMQAAAAASVSLSTVDALRLAIETAGSQAAFARLIGRPQQTISDWVRRGDELPPEYVLTVERELGISRHDLRPDIYPREDIAPAADAARLQDVRP